MLNRGVNGEDAREMLARFDQSVIAESPDLVLWQVGTNALLLDRPLFPAGERIREGILAPARAILGAEPGLKLDYLELRDERTCEVPPEPVVDSRVLVAARLGTTRLIDNVGLLEEDA